MEPGADEATLLPDNLSTVKEPSKESPFSTGLKDIVAGSFRGFSQVLAGHPLDLVKVRLQTQSVDQPKFSGVFDCLAQTVRREGFTSLYKGALSPVMFAGAYSALLFLAYGQAKRLFLPSDPRQPPTYLQLAGVGATCGSVCSLVEGPMDMVKSRMQVQYEARGRYRNSIDCLIQIVREHGVLALYRGFGVTVLRNVPGSTVYFSCYELIRRRFLPTVDADDGQAAAPHTLGVILAGGVSGILFWASIYPLDVLKSRIQADAYPYKYKGVWDCAVKTYREGPRTFFSGFKACLIRSFPVNAITFVVYEKTRALLG